MRSPTAASQTWDRYEKIVRIDYHIGLDRVTISYDPRREFVRKMNRIFNDPLPPADTSTPLWGCHDYTP